MSQQQPFFEMHFHTSLSSACGHVDVEDSLPKFKELGYDGIVITDHFRDESFDGLDPSLSWAQKADVWLRGYQAARRVGDEIGLTVLLGMELRFAGPDQVNEYLLYGLSEQQVRNCVDLYTWGEERTSAYARAHGLFMAQSHPFRPDMTRYNPALLDGMEVHNSNPRWDSRNDLAEAYAAEVGLRPLAGSDFHEWVDLVGSGLRFHRPIPDSTALVAALKDRAYDLVRSSALHADA